MIKDIQGEKIQLVRNRFSETELRPHVPTAALRAHIWNTLLDGLTPYVLTRSSTSNARTCAPSRYVHQQRRHSPSERS
jgi:hypothetical protein